MNRRDFLKLATFGTVATMLPFGETVAAPELVKGEVGAWQSMTIKGVSNALTLADIERAREILNANATGYPEALYLMRCKWMSREELEQMYPGVQVLEPQPLPLVRDCRRALGLTA